MDLKRHLENLNGSKKLILSIAVPLLLLIGIGSWAVSSPVASSPDDDFHMVSIWCSGDGVSNVCEPSGSSTTRYVSRGLTESRCYVFLPKQSAICQSEQRIFSANGLIESDRGSFNSNYPPLYYSFMHYFAGGDIQFSIVLMRMVNVFIFVLLNCWLWFALPRKFHVTQIMMWAITLVPLGVSIIASINPSSWAITGVGLSWLALYAWLKAPKNKLRNNWQLISIFIISSIMAAGARADAAIYVICGVAAAVVLAGRKGTFRFKRILAPIFVVAVCLAFFVTSGQSAVVGDGLPPEIRTAVTPQSLSAQLALLLGNLIQMPSLFLGAFGYWDLGWTDTEMPIFTWVASGAIFAGVIFVGLKGMFGRQIFVTIMLGIVLCLIPLYVLQKSLVPVGTQVQPRYLLPLLLIFSGVVLLPRVNISLKYSKPQIGIVAIGLSLAFSLALHFNIRRYVTGEDVHNPNLNAQIEWWWSQMPSPMFVWIAGSISVMLLAIIFYRSYSSPRAMLAKP